MAVGLFLMGVLVVGGGIFMTRDDPGNSWQFKTGVMLITLSITVIVWGASASVLVDIFMGAPQ